MKKEPSPFKKLVQAMLKKEGKTQKQLAETLNMEESNLSHLLSRGTTDPHIMKIIAQFLKFDVSLFNRDSQIKSPGTSVQLNDKNPPEEVQYLKQVLQAKDQVIESQKELIATLKEKLDRK